jgi:lipoprotein-anchoring transpeptidase ErfK/SrfK
MRRAGLRIAAGAAAGAVIAVAAAAATSPSSPHPRATAPARASGLPAPVAPAFVPGPARRLRADPDATRWAPVRRAVAVRRRPVLGAPTLAALGTRTPEGSANVVLATGHREDAAGRPWVRVTLPSTGAPRAGWVPRAAVGGYTTVRTRLVVDLRRLRATLYRAGRPVFRAPVGVGRAGAPTPRGRFYVRDRLTRYRSPAYGPIAFGTSARSPTLTDWPAGGYVGIHGTDRPDLIPGRISHGCIRLRNPDLLALARRMPVGTPLLVR